MFDGVLKSTISCKICSMVVFKSNYIFNFCAHVLL